MALFINNNFDNQSYVTTDTSVAEDSGFRPQDIPMNKTRSDWSAIQGDSPQTIDGIRRGMNQGSINPLEGDLQMIDPDGSEVQTGTEVRIPVVSDREMTVLLDSGLQARVGEEGVKFEFLNRGHEILMTANSETDK